MASHRRKLQAREASGSGAAADSSMDTESNEEGA
jgi:hypothetical protein